MKRIQTDLAVIGGGCAGMAGALSAKKHGVRDVLIIERSPYLGGVLHQCIHNGFGVYQFHEDLTGTEFADQYLRQVAAEAIAMMRQSLVLDITADHTVTVMNREGMIEVEAKAILLATGCRERPRGALLIPGSRPSGIFTAGTAQRYMNLEGFLVGRRIVILGSGDIGLIMARQFILEGAQVLAVAEIQPYSTGLTRNIVQCLQDYDIPIYYNTTVTQIKGSKRLTGVTLAKTDERRNPIPGTERDIACDTLILSVGLIPENELAYQAGIPLDPVTGGAIVDDRFQTAVPGIFAAGNALHVHDLADFVTAESEEAGRHIASYILQKPITEIAKVPVIGGPAVLGVVPQQIAAGAEGTVCLRFRPAGQYINCKTAVYSGETLIAQKRNPVVTPGEMCEIMIDRSLVNGPVRVQVEP
ncbi:MAG: FAD-dependent oxidoreductase [Firmicutes bacterium]|nr:FAD-dependent oxidoreductase [Bacillota bacterium]